MVNLLQWCMRMGFYKCLMSREPVIIYFHSSKNIRLQLSVVEAKVEIMYSPAANVMGNK